VIPITKSLCGSEPLIGNCIGDGVTLLDRKGNSHDSSGTVGDSSILSIRDITLRSDYSSLLLSEAFDGGTYSFSAIESSSSTSSSDGHIIAVSVAGALYHYVHQNL